MAAFQLHTVERPRLSSSIVDQLLTGIESGAFPQGHALPAERILAARLGVSRSSVREAIRVLEHAGILDVRTGSGTYVVDTGSPKVASLRAQASLTGEQSPLDVMAARYAVEPACAKAAAAQRHERDLELIREAVSAQARLVEAGEDAASADLDFHLAVAGGTHNPVLLQLVERIVEIMRRRPWIDLKHSSRENPAAARRDVRQHGAILRAIELGDPPAASRAMRTHLASVERDLLAQVE
jgi:GntR family transcriptional repressor for pyruvate dehydrogenase complex